MLGFETRKIWVRFESRRTRLYFEVISYSLVPHQVTDSGTHLLHIYKSNNLVEDVKIHVKYIESRFKVWEVVL